MLVFGYHVFWSEIYILKALFLAEMPCLFSLSTQPHGFMHARQMLYTLNSTNGLSETSLSGGGKAVPGHCSHMASMDAAMVWKRPWNTGKGQLPTGPPRTFLRREHTTFFLIHGNGNQGSPNGFLDILKDVSHHYQVGTKCWIST